MKEEQAVLEFFSQAENLPLGLSVAEQMDLIREQMNTRFWKELRSRINMLISDLGLDWRVELTEERNSPGSLVGLYCITNKEQMLYLSPMMEQQYLGEVWRIYFGLMWSTPATTELLRLPDVIGLKAALQKAGFKSNENFLGWQWTNFHPRRKDFLLRYSKQPEILLAEVEELFIALLSDHSNAIEQIHAASKNTPKSLSASLPKLRDELID
jgi:hypothetical protein